MDNYLFKTYNGLIVFVILFSLNGCQKTDLDEINNLNGNKITIIGHGGLGFESAQNALPHDSFSSLTKAVEAYGVEWVEADIQLSADDVFFTFHSPFLETETDCFGCIFFKESEALKNCRYRSSLQSSRFLDEKLGTLESLLQRFSERPIKPTVVLDIKLAIPECGDFDFNNHQQRFMDEMVRLITKYDASDWCVVDAAELDFLAALKEKLPSIKLSLKTGYFSEDEAIYAVSKGVYMISCDNDLTTKEYVQMCHENGLRVAIYGVKERNGAIEAINKSPDYIFTDNIILLQQMLR